MKVTDLLDELLLVLGEHGDIAIAINGSNGNLTKDVSVVVEQLSNRIAVVPSRPGSSVFVGVQVAGPRERVCIVEETE